MASFLVPFTQDHLASAVKLFLATYRREQRHSPLLPSCLLEDPAPIRQALAARLAYPGVVIIQGHQVQAYMLTGDQFAWKGQQAALVPEYGHGAVEENKRDLYRRMYMALAQTWADHHIHLHALAYPRPAYDHGCRGRHCGRCRDDWRPRRNCRPSSYARRDPDHYPAARAYLPSLCSHRPP